MDNRKIDFGKKEKPAEASPNAIKMELSDEELAQVSGGNADRSSAKLFQACVSGAHIKIGRIT